MGESGAAPPHRSSQSRLTRRREDHEVEADEHAEARKLSERSGTERLLRLTENENDDDFDDDDDERAGSRVIITAQGLVTALCMYEAERSPIRSKEQSMNEKE